MTSPTLHSFCQVGCLLPPTLSTSHSHSLGEDLLWPNQLMPAKLFTLADISWLGTASTRLLRHKLTLSHVVRPVDLWSELQMSGHRTFFEVTWPYWWEKLILVRQNKVDEDTGTIMSKNCRPRKSWGVRLKSKCYHDDHDDHGDGHDGYDDNDEIQRNSCLGWFLSDLVFDGSRWWL